MTMNEDLKNRWAARLEEGKLAQARGVLVEVKPELQDLAGKEFGNRVKTPEDLRFCCLGVLTLMAIEDGLDTVRLHMPTGPSDQAYFEICEPPTDPETGEPLTTGEGEWKRPDNEDLCAPVREWAGVRYSNPALGRATCAELNDGRAGDESAMPGETPWKVKPHSFTEIAALIRQEKM